ncbi:HlyD family secretion protein [Psychromonas sp. RZ22]|uniref:HlyD family secretion protein n=1 Tax=Psychromonas algarum TaxID=2555643 RepID=UPI0010686B34|nr:HlyD family secretion protein [Psychromonas sp. RZ22]TEW55334.1 HlyD family secretion protein [Psychromonas sp. RZ22]
MDLLLVLTYSAVCLVIFKVFKIPLNKWTVPTAVLGGIALIGTLIMLMNYNHPYSEASREYFITTPIMPSVRGTVVSVEAKANTPMKKGDVLFTIDPVPFQSQVDALSAQLIKAEKDLQRARELRRKRLGSQESVDTQTSLVNNLKAQLEGAKYNLDNTVVRAQTDGYVTQMMVFPGLYVVPMPLRPAMVFVQEDSFRYVGWYRQNSTLRLKAGFEAEMAFDGIPGKVFTGKVVQVLPVLAEGEVQASGRLINFNAIDMPGRVPVVIEIDDPRFDEYRDLLPGGAYGQTAIYSDSFHHVAIMRRVLLRMSSWMSYFFPFH